MRSGRALALLCALTTVIGSYVGLASVARAQECPPSPGLPDDWCKVTPPPGGSTPTPKPTASATTKPTAAPTKAPLATKAPVVAPVTRTRAPVVTQAPIELESTPKINLETVEPVFPSEFPLDQGDGAESQASVSTWIFGFIVGFLLGALIGRASWGFSRRRRRQQIFG